MVLPGATVRVLDKTGTQVFSGTTDANGWIKDISVVTTVHRQSGANPAVIDTDLRGPHQIVVSLAGYAASTQSTTLNQSQNLSVQLTPTENETGVANNYNMEQNTSPSFLALICWRQETTLSQVAALRHPTVRRPSN